eukprot:2264783-Heterocapsa_arctica.AAC.1
MEPRWVQAWLGHRSASSEHQVAISADCVLCGRSCRPLGRDSLDYEEVQRLWDIWAHEVQEGQEPRLA